MARIPEAIATMTFVAICCLLFMNYDAQGPLLDVFF